MQFVEFGKRFIGLKNRLKNLEKIAKMEDDIDNIASQNWEINTRYGIQESTKGMSVSINRGNGDFILDGKIGETLNRPNIWEKEK